MAALQQGTAAGVMCLRTINPYVQAALSDWLRRGTVAPAVPRATATLPRGHVPTALAGMFHSIPNVQE